MHHDLVSHEMSNLMQVLYMPPPACSPCCQNPSSTLKLSW